MRLDDIQLRDSARRGEVAACLEIAARLFAGRGGFAVNHKLGLAYLQQELAKGTLSALKLVGEEVPLDVLMAQQGRPVLAAAARMGSRGAMLKLGLWLMLEPGRWVEASEWIRRSERFDPPVWDPAAGDTGPLISMLRQGQKHAAVADPAAVALHAATDAVRREDLLAACRGLNLAAALGASTQALAQPVHRAVQLAARGQTGFALPVAAVEACLLACSDLQDAQAQLALGCAYAGVAYAALPAEMLVVAPKPARAAALLLRAAHAGLRDAWLHLSRIASGYRHPIASDETSRFFLEKAAEAEVACAQRRLGAILLKEATSLRAAEQGVQWLSRAAESGDARAQELLETLVLPMPALPPDAEAALLNRVSTIDPELGLRLALVRSLHLTRHEAMSFDPRRDLRPWGLALAGSSKANPKGRPAPAVSPGMQAQLQRARAFYETAPIIAGGLMLQRCRRQRRLFKELGVAEEAFFAPEIGRSRTHYGFGRHWGLRAALLLSGDLQ